MPAIPVISRIPSLSSWMLVNTELCVLCSHEFPGQDRPVKKRRSNEGSNQPLGPTQKKTTRSSSTKIRSTKVSIRPASGKKGAAGSQGTRRVSTPKKSFQPEAMLQALTAAPNYKAVAIAVRAVLWEQGPQYFRNPPLNSPDEIPPEYNLGAPPPIGFAPSVVKSLRPRCNKLIQDLRPDHSANHPISAADFGKITTVGTMSDPKTSLVDVVYGKITEP